MITVRNTEKPFQIAKDLIVAMKLSLKSKINRPIETIDSKINNPINQPNKTNDLEKKVSGSLIYRGWSTSNHFFKKIYEKTIECILTKLLLKMKILLYKKFYKIIFIKSLKFKQKLQKK
jgi:hypothetical protein